MRAVPIDGESRIAEVRRRAVAFSKSIDFNEAESGRVAIVATELATNILKHAGEGEILLSTFDDGEGAGVECIALDRGAGMADVSLSMRDGHSTAGSPGTGLGAIQRQSQVLEIYSSPKRGTAVLVRLYKGRGDGAAVRKHPAYGAISVPIAGEEACGDAWSARRVGGLLTLMVVDGLGHGPLAATASHAAIRVFETTNPEPTIALIEKMHAALRPTRGAAASIAQITDDPGGVVFVGVGNVAGVVIQNAVAARRMVSYNGTLGHALKTVKPFTYPAEGETLVVLASDGLGTSWSLDDYPGLSQRHPSLIAAVLYRDFSRRRDDVTVLVGRRLAA